VFQFSAFDAKNQSTMILSNKILASFDRLKEIGLPQSLDSGRMVGRGFSDLGYEQFLILSGERIISCFTGKTTDFKPEEREHFFQILNADELTLEIIKLGWDIAGVNHVDGRRWELKLVKAGEDSKVVFSENSLLEVLLQAVSFCLEKKVNNDKL